MLSWAGRRELVIFVGNEFFVLQAELHDNFNKGL